MPLTSLQRALQGSLIVMGAFLVFLYYTESAVISPRNETQQINFTRNVLDILSRGEQRHADEMTRRYSPLLEINETAESIQELEYLLHVERGENANSRERRQETRRQCFFGANTPTILRGYCFYDFPFSIVTCKIGDQLSFDASECPRRPPSPPGSRRRRTTKRIVRTRSWGFGDPGWPQCHNEVLRQHFYNGVCETFGIDGGLCLNQHLGMSAVSRQCSRSR